MLSRGILAAGIPEVDIPAVDTVTGGEALTLYEV
jgi:hypothetical protein